MRHLIAFTLLVAVATTARATPFTFTPSDHDLGDLDHTDAYTWGINSTSSGASYATLVSQLGSGYQITSATLTISNLYNWSASDTHNTLFIHLLDNPRAGVNSVTDDPTDNGVNQGVLSDYFNGLLAGNKVGGNWVAYGYTSGGSLVATGGTNITLTQYQDGDGPNTVTQYSYAFTAPQLATLTSYITNGHTGNSSYVDFGMGFDPDCHYYNSCVQLTLNTAQSVPDVASTAGLFGVAAAVLLVGTRRSRRAC